MEYMNKDLTPGDVQVSWKASDTGPGRHRQEWITTRVDSGVAGAVTSREVPSGVNRALPSETKSVSV